MIQSAEDLERVIWRSTMNRGQVTLLKYLYEVDDEYVKRDDVVRDIREGNHEGFVGVLAAFSNRVNHTEGISGNPGYEAFIERENLSGEEHFRLREEARRAIDEVQGLQDVFAERSMDELLDSKGVPVEFEPPSLADTVTDIEGREEIGWSPTTPENRLLVGYWKQVRGTIVTEVEQGERSVELAVRFRSTTNRWPSIQFGI
jgi:hypothetical protein